MLDAEARCDVMYLCRSTTAPSSEALLSRVLQVNACSVFKGSYEFEFKIYNRGCLLPSLVLGGVRQS